MLPRTVFGRRTPQARAESLTGRWQSWRGDRSVTLRALYAASQALTFRAQNFPFSACLERPHIDIGASAALPTHKGSTVTLDHSRSRVALLRMDPVDTGLTSAALLHIHSSIVQVVAVHLQTVP